MAGSKFVIVGGGMVAGYASKQLVELGTRQGDLTILSADSSIPYERPPLSKGFLAGKDSEESILINPADFYKQQGIDLRLGCTVLGLDLEHKAVSLSTGESLHFEKLIAATGSRVRKLDVPGAGLANVQYLRSLDDSKAIRERAQAAKHAVVVGGGFIGMEVAAVLAQRKIDVTVILREGRIWERFFTPEMSGFFEQYYAARGVRFVRMAKIAALKGDQAVSAVVLENGESIACELVVAGVGVEPVTELFSQSGIQVKDGVVVNEFLETSAAGVLAAGDVANYWDVLFERRRRVEHWDNAVSQGQHCAHIAMGERIPFRHVPYFFSDVFDLSYEYWGDSSNADVVVHRGELSSGSFSVWWLRGSVVVAVFVMKRPDEERDLAQKWIAAKTRLSARALGDASRPIQDAPGDRT